ncbi:MAG: hypothetical protein KGJ13_07240 [Patescibacteria group bacterium]|nr:hypothetical protein [Patescibacteria group bacterium]
MGNRIIRATLLAFAFLFGVNSANAQTCNSPSGFIQSFGTFSIGDIATFGPDCNHIISGGLSLNLTVLSLTIGTATLNAPNNDNIWQQTGTGNSVSTAYHLNPGTGTINTGTITEFVAQTTLAQAFGGNYGRLSFGTVGSSNGYEMGWFGEFGGTTAINAMGPIIVQNAVENPAGTFVLTEFWRGITISGGSEDTNLGAVNFGVNLSGNANLVVLNSKIPSVAGTQDSAALLFAGKSFDGVTTRAEYWRLKANVTSQSGASQLLISSNLNGGGYNTRLTLTDAGTLSVANIDNSIIGAATPAAGTFSALSFKAGNSATNISPSGKITAQLTPTGNGADTTEDTCQTFNLPANVLDIAGRGVRIRAWGTLANNADTKTVRTYFGSNIYNSTPLTTANVGWSIYSDVFKTGTNTQTAISSGTFGNALPGTQAISPNQTDSSPITVKITAQAGTANANDIVCQGMTIDVIE